MKRARLLSISALVGSLVAGVFFAGSSTLGQGPGSGQGTVIVPESSVERPEDLGVRAHTNHLIMVRPTRGGGGGGSGNAINSFETPGSLACIYGTAPLPTTGCPTGSSTTPPSGGSNSLPTGGSGTIAIVDAFDYPTAASDLSFFSSTFGLPPANFQVVYASGSQPSLNCGWAQEAALDIEWAHAMAPGAKIVLVEANSNSFSDLFSAVQVAANEVLCGSPSSCPTGSNGVGEVSMSWGGREFVSESTNDGFMATAGVTYFAASGDSGGKTIYPSASPNVVSCGGTSIVRSTSTGAFVTEQGWSGSGGGGSRFEPAPGYQSVIASIVGSKRGTPDFSFDADPNSGVWVYDTTPCNGASGWLVFGGTSVATPSLAGIVNLASSTNTGFSTTNNGEQTRIYNCYNPNTTGCYSADYFDVTTGAAGSFSATTGWDFVTGVGTNRGLQGK